ncbi:MAG: response regulator [Nitrosomonadales bacterium]|nr:response regulator [Nitrosomonadales bacterium]
MSNKGNILAVDDTPASLRLLTDLLKNEGYEVRSAINGELALHAALEAPPDLMLLDIRMPGMDGYEVCRRLKAEDSLRDIPVIFVSAASEMDEKLMGFRVGAVDYVTKPYQRAELVARVSTHMELHQLRDHLEETIQTRTSQLLESEKRLRGSLLSSIEALASMVEFRDPYTAGHQRRVATLADEIAKGMGLDPNQTEGIKLAAIVHDVGKIQVPAEILSMPRRLSELEFGLIKTHSQIGYDILKSIDFPWPIAQIVWQHHERMDGTGYPQGLKGEDILLEARIIGVADVVEAMFSHRPYRPGLGIGAAMEELLNHRGTMYDPAVVDVCIKLFREEGFNFPD